jgi:hypothetical protein
MKRTSGDEYALDMNEGFPPRSGLLWSIWTSISWNRDSPPSAAQILMIFMLTPVERLNLCALELPLRTNHNVDAAAAPVADRHPLGTGSGKGSGRAFNTNSLVCGTSAVMNLKGWQLDQRQKGGQLWLDRALPIW